MEDSQVSRPSERNVLDVITESKASVTNVSRSNLKLRELQGIAVVREY